MVAMSLMSHLEMSAGKGKACSFWITETWDKEAESNLPCLAKPWSTFFLAHFMLQLALSIWVLQLFSSSGFGHCCQLPQPGPVEHFHRPGRKARRGTFQQPFSQPVSKVAEGHQIVKSQPRASIVRSSRESILIKTIQYHFSLAGQVVYVSISCQLSLFPGLRFRPSAFSFELIQAGSHLGSAPSL